MLVAERRELADAHRIDSCGPFIRTHPLPGTYEVFRSEDALHHVFGLRVPMPPVVTALMRTLPSGSIGWHVLHEVGTLLLGSALRGREAPVSLFKRTLAAPGSLLTTRACY